jgi:hypothetical protein
MRIKVFVAVTIHNIFFELLSHNKQTYHSNLSTPSTPLSKIVNMIIMSFLVRIRYDVLVDVSVSQICLLIEEKRL